MQLSYMVEKHYLLYFDIIVYIFAANHPASGGNNISVAGMSWYVDSLRSLGKYRSKQDYKPSS